MCFPAPILLSRRRAEISRTQTASNGLIRASFCTDAALDALILIDNRGFKTSLPYRIYRGKGHTGTGMILRTALSNDNGHGASFNFRQHSEAGLRAGFEA